jgi:dihydrodiol dehydrogenase / D-xylose 1-dehydrogenase (NADP)
MAAKIRWGILGTGAIAKQFAKGLSALPDAELTAVGSRTAASAEAFGNEFNVKHRHSSYAGLASDVDVDVIYVATPHPMHASNTKLCLDARKHVLCEKPFTVNAFEAREIVASAREKKLFLMEAMWTRFIPVIVRVRQWIKEGAIGKPRMVLADFGFRASVDDTSRLLDPALAGGGLLDVGIYPISFACMIFGQLPVTVTGQAEIGKTGVDEQAGILLKFPDSQLAVLSCAVRTETPQSAHILGENGSITIHAPFWKATTATLTPADGESMTVELPLSGNGYNYQAEEVMRCIRSGKLESEIMPLDESIALMKVMDDLRSLWGVQYPSETMPGLPRTTTTPAE